VGFLNAILDPGKDERRRAREAFDGVRVPTPEELRVTPEDYQLAGLYDPEQLDVVDLDETAFAGITEDPRLRGSQLGALDEFETIASEGGLDARARARTQDALEAQRTESQGSQGAILADLRARGLVREPTAPRSPRGRRARLKAAKPVSDLVADQRR